MTPAKAGTSAVLAVVGAAVLLLVLVTWAASIGPDRVLSGGHVAPVAPLTPTSSTPVVGEEPDPIERARDEHRADEAPVVRMYSTQDWAQSSILCSGGISASCQASSNDSGQARSSS